MKYFFITGIEICLFLLTSCKDASVSVSASVDPSGWNAGEEKSISFMNEDTVSLRRLTVFLAYGRELAENRDWSIVVRVMTPDSLEFTEAVSVRRVELESKQRLSVGRILYRSDAVLNQSGEYVFSFRHTSAEPLQGVRAIGMEITDNPHGKR